MGASLAASAQSEHLKSVDKAGFDNTVRPGDDFYHHINNGWMKAHPLDAEHARYGNFDILADTSAERVRGLVNSLAATNPQPGTVAHKIATIYGQYMDQASRDALGAKPIQAGIEHIQNAKPSEMEDLWIWMQKSWGSPFVSAGPMEDMANSSQYAMYIGGPGLGLGDRDYYLNDDARSKEVLAAYKKLIVGQMMNAGFSKKEATRIMNNVIKIETAMAHEAWTKERSRDVPSQYNPRTIAQLKADYPQIPWERMFTETMNIATPEQVIVTQAEPIANGAKLYSTLKPREVKDYYLWDFVSGAAPYLSQPFFDTSFEFSKVMTGVQEPRPQWKRALSTTEGLLGEGIGQLYVEKYFPESSKQYMTGLVENLRTSLGKHIIDLDWMTTDTKLKALNKLNAFTVKIGYPDKWKDYTTLNIDPKLSYYENMHNVSMWHQKEELAKWGKPVDKTEWGMTPQTVNAYYNPLANEIVFPAGILQAPFFDPEASDAENYGGIGVVIGHEMTHGFDDQGRNFDAEGNMTDWWTPEDAEAFAKLTSGLIAQFDEVEVLPGVHANGQYTLGENIADQGGLRVARTAFLDSQKKKGVDINSDSALIDGIHPMQVYYLNYANIWAGNIRDEEIRSLTTGDVHSLGENRVNVTLRNITPFFEAFGIKEGDKMYRPAEEQVIIW